MAKKKENNKVLISFLGTGPFHKNGSKREYNKAHYRLGDDDLGEYPFVASALMRHYNAKKVVLVGTVHSMWEEVYRWFSEDKVRPAGKEKEKDSPFKFGDRVEASIDGEWCEAVVIEIDHSDIPYKVATPNGDIHWCAKSRVRRA